MSLPSMNLEEVIAQIGRLDHEREDIYADDKVTGAEHPRLKEIEHELARLWDLRRRLEAARDAGLNEIPVPPPADPENLIG
ncbi:MAG TPA: DUF2630 family protein [Roseiflexaceae bacterium]|nr:DUF2630 family protein [Roseiflexaceae bacterium]